METPTSNAEAPALPTRYATFGRRLRAVLVDTAIVCAGIAVVAIASDVASEVPGSGRVGLLLMICLLFLYEPILIWRRGATIGHARNHLIVVADATGRAPGLGRAFARYFVKAILGLPSFIAMAVSRKHQAVHDLLTGTTVQLSPDAPFNAVDFHIERTDEPVRYRPSAWRRLIVALCYLVVMFLAYGLVLAAVDPTRCLRNHNCSASLQSVTDSITLAWFVASLVCVVAAWKCLLPGTRYVKAPAAVGRDVNERC